MAYHFSLWEKLSSGSSEHLRVFSRIYACGQSDDIIPNRECQDALIEPPDRKTDG